MQITNPKPVAPVCGDQLPICVEHGMRIVNLSLFLLAGLVETAERQPHPSLFRQRLVPREELPRERLRVLSSFRSACDGLHSIQCNTIHSMHPCVSLDCVHTWRPHEGKALGEGEEGRALGFSGLGNGRALCEVVVRV